MKKVLSRLSFSNAKKIGFMLSAVTMSLTLIPTSAFAIDKEFFSGNDILFYDPDLCVVSGTGTSNLVGNDNLEKILRYFVGKGLTLQQAAGIAGNLQQESGFNPAKIEGGKIAPDDYVPVLGTGFGIAQWTTPKSRQDGLVALSQSSNRKITDLSLQLDYMWQELTTHYAGAITDLKQQTTPDDAAYVFHKDYEGSNDTEAFVKKVRGGNAINIYQQFQSIIPDGTTASSSGAGSSATCTGDGQPTQYVNGFTFYDQYDPQWKDKPYGNSTIGDAGCGPAAMAMIISTLTGQSVTPLDTATYGAAHGTTYEGGKGGSAWNIQTVIGNNWGLQSTKLTPDVAKINDALRHGDLVITSGTGAAPFTGAGHYIVIRAIASDGQWLIGDSDGEAGKANNTKEWDPGYILNIASGDNIWAVSK